MARSIGFPFVTMAGGYPYRERVEPVSRELFSYVEKMIIGTLIVSAGEHVSISEPAIVLFGYLRHGLVGRGVQLFGVILLS
jgi:hypothetical protein